MTGVLVDRVVKWAAVEATVSFYKTCRLGRCGDRTHLVTAEPAGQLQLAPLHWREDRMHASRIGESGERNNDRRAHT
jgi:hypothetical protein